MAFEAIQDITEGSEHIARGPNVKLTVPCSHKFKIHAAILASTCMHL